jgi:hypothetical protein
MSMRSSRVVDGIKPSLWKKSSQILGESSQIMAESGVVRGMTADFNIATALGSIQASADTVESDEAVLNTKEQKYKKIKIPLLSCFTVHFQRDSPLPPFLHTNRENPSPTLAVHLQKESLSHPCCTLKERVPLPPLLYIY